MRIHLMGTAAAEGWPAVWCDCRACRKARELKGKNLRTRSGAVIDNDLKIDLPPDTYAQSLRDNLDLSQIQHIFITHTHQDHYYPSELGMSLPPFSHSGSPLQIWGNRWAIEQMKSILPNWPYQDSVHVMQAFTPVAFAETRILPLQAAHFKGQGGFNYIVERAGKTLLYGLDSGWFPNESWEAQKPFNFDVVILDCTHGPIPGGELHGGTDTVVATRKRMLENGTASSFTVFVATHFSHNGGMLHDELVNQLTPHGIEVAYDGMVIEV